MSLLTKIKSVLGLEEDATRRRDLGDQTVTFGSAPDDSPPVSDSPTPDTESERAVKDAAESADETPEPSGSTDPPEESDPVAGSDDPVTDIKGIGPTYAEQLAAAGIETVADLAAADADTIEAETGLSATRAAGWIEQAQAR